MKKKSLTSAALLVLSASLVLSGCVAAPESTIGSSYDSTVGETQGPTFDPIDETDPTQPAETEVEGNSDSMTNDATTPSEIDPSVSSDSNEILPPETNPETGSEITPETDPVETVPETEPEETVPDETEPDVEAGMSFTKVNETVYANTTVNIRIGPSTDYKKIGSLKWGDKITRIGRGDHGWDKVLYNDVPAYMYSKYIQTEEPVATPAVTYPLSYSDDSCTITITKEWFENAWCYIAHLEFTDYTRFGMECAKGKYDSGTETTSHAAKRINAIFAVNGDYTTPEMGNDVVRNGVVWKNTQLHSAAIYNANTGLFSDIGDIGYQWTEDLVANGQLTDTFSFFRWNLVNGDTLNSDNSSRAQRTSIGTTGKAGDIYIVVSEGRYADGESAGLTFNQCARLMKSLGCTFAIPLDGGGSSTMYFHGKVLNANGANERAVVDFVVFR